MERRDLYQDDLTEERYPSPAQRDDESATQALDPDAPADDGDTVPAPDAAKGPLGYPHGVPGGVHGDPETDDDDDEDDEDDGDDEE
jgi:hypothetical protein